MICTYVNLFCTHFNTLYFNRIKKQAQFKSSRVISISSVRFFLHRRCFKIRTASDGGKLPRRTFSYAFIRMERSAIPNGNMDGRNRSFYRAHRLSPPTRHHVQHLTGNAVNFWWISLNIKLFTLHGWLPLATFSPFVLSFILTSN